MMTELARGARRSWQVVLIWIAAVTISGHYVYTTYENQKHDDCRENFQLAFIAQIAERGRTGTANTEAIDKMVTGLRTTLTAPIPTNLVQATAERGRVNAVFDTYDAERAASDKDRAAHPYPAFPDC